MKPYCLLQHIIDVHSAVHGYPRIRAPSDKPKVYKVSIYKLNLQSELREMNQAKETMFREVERRKKIKVETNIGFLKSY